MNRLPEITETVAVDAGVICYPWRGHFVLGEVVDHRPRSRNEPRRRQAIGVEMEHQNGERRTYYVPLAAVRKP